jgi:hypothetical protein
MSRRAAKDSSAAPRLIVRPFAHQTTAFVPVVQPQIRDDVLLKLKMRCGARVG